MSFKKLRKIFNRVSTNTAFLVAAVGASIGGGFYANSTLEQYHAQTAPVANVALHDAEVSQLKTLGDDIIENQTRIDFNARSLQQAQQNIGTAPTPLGNQLADLQSARDQQARDEAAQQEKLAQYRKAIWFNPALSEKEADDVYKELFYKAQEKGMGNITNYFSPMTDALTFRDEVIAAMNLPLDPAKVTNKQAEDALNAARAHDDANDALETKGALGTAFGGGLLTLGLAVLGFRARRREEEERETLKLQEETAREAAKAAERQMRARERVQVREEPETPAPAVQKSAGHKLSL